MTPLERSLRIAVIWLVPSLVLSAGLLVIDVRRDLLAATTIHLSAIVLATLWLTIRLTPLSDAGWFGTVSSRTQRRFATAATLAAIVTGYAALTTLASSAALRLDPSLQFLQLLSALDIAWVVAATTIGSRWLLGENVGRGAGVAMSIVCVWSIWRYLDHVGFGPNGEWVVSGDALRELVLPFDTMAAAIALTLAWLGARAQATEQPTPQS